MCFESIKKPLANLEGWWFDLTRHVSTAGTVPMDGLTLAGSAKRGFMYLPVRALPVRLALRDLPIKEPRNYTFVDLGSGKGRMLFLAAEYPFRRIEGVEFAVELHAEAERNIARYRHRRRRCQQIESLNADAAEYVFPKENLVIALFNPFGPEVMETVLRRVRSSVEEHPRDVLLMMMFPELAAVVESTSHWRAHKCTRRYHIYRMLSPGESADPVRH
jgi:hypothetical protein